MGENLKDAANPFKPGVEDPKVQSFKWGFNFKSIKGANTDITYGWKASGVYGLSTSIYVTPASIPVVTALPAIPMALTTMVSDSSTVYSAAMAWSNWTQAFTATNITDLSKRTRAKLMRAPAYMTIEVGAKCDFIFGNKYDYCTGSVNKSVNGETVKCYADKIEWYYANAYKYIGGTELKIEAKDKKLTVTPSEKKNLTKADVFNDKTSYADNYVINAAYEKSIASKDIDHMAGANLNQVAKETYTLNAKSLNLTSGDSNIKLTAKKEINLISTKNTNVGTVSGTITMRCGPKKAIVVSSGKTDINNQLSLGMPGVDAIPDVASALAAYNKQVSELEKDVKTASSDILDLKCEVDNLWNAL